MSKRSSSIYRNQSHIDFQNDQKRQNRKKVPNIPDVQKGIDRILARQGRTIKPGFASVLLSLNLLGSIVFANAECPLPDERDDPMMADLIPPPSNSKSSVQSAFQDLVDQGRLQSDPGILPSACQMQAKKYTQSAINLFPEEKLKFIRVLQNPQFFIRCVNPNGLNDRLVTNLAPDTGDVFFLIPIPTPYLSFNEQSTTKHEFRHSDVMLRNLRPSCRKDSYLSRFVPLHPDDAENRSLFFKNFESGKNRIRDFIELQSSKEPLSRKQKASLTDYQEASRDIPSFNLDQAMPRDVYAKFKRHISGKKFPNLKHSHQQATVPYEVKISAIKSIAGDTVLNIIHLFLKDGSPMAILEVTRPLDKLISIFKKLDQVAAEHNDSNPNIKIAELDANARQFLSKKAFGAFFKELDEYDNHLDKLCFAEEETQNLASCR